MSDRDQGPALKLRRRAEAATRVLPDIVESLPPEVRPSRFSGFGDSQVETSDEEGGERELSGWKYDWNDKGSDPPPWSDWNQKEDGSN